MATGDDTSSEPQLKRTIGIGQLTLYALGSMLGSGIYGLIGKAAGLTGNAVWLSFLVALVAALMTALSYASLGSRYPRAGGAAYVLGIGFYMWKSIQFHNAIWHGFVAGASALHFAAVASAN